MRNFLSLAVALFMLAGCVTTGPDGKPIDNTPALVIVGFVYTGEQRTALGGCHVGRFGPFAGNYNLDFFKLDANNRTSLLFGRVFAMDGACEPANSPTAARYNFLELAPGRHLLAGITNASLQQWIRFRNAPIITVAPGEVVYVGDVTFSGTFSRTQISGAEPLFVNTEAGARAALAARQGPVDRLTTRLMTVPEARPVYQ
jgi:hypothetical protein